MNLQIESEIRPNYSRVSILEALPSEAILKILSYLDSQTLVSKVTYCCHTLYILCNEKVLWKKLCKDTRRIIGSHTKKITHKYASIHGWKRCYYWIALKDLEASKDVDDLCEAANAIETDALKKHYLFARALDGQFANSGVILEQYADFLSDLPDVDNNWQVAESYYRLSLDLFKAARKKLKVEKQNAQTVSVTPEGEDQGSEQAIQRRKTKEQLLFALFRYSHFLAYKCNNLQLADYYYRKLLRLLPNNAWVYERYAEFSIDLLKQYDLAERLYRLVLSADVSGTAIANYAIFLWQIRRNYVLAGKCFKLSCELRMEKAYYYANFMARQLKDEKAAKQILLDSKLHAYVKEHADNEQEVFALALAFHQVHAVEEAEIYYRHHFSLSHNVYTLSNLAELLIHSLHKFEEGEALYLKGINTLTSGARETIEVALASLHLIMDKSGALEKLRSLLSSSYIQCTRTTYTEGWIIYFIHCQAHEKLMALTAAKKLLITEAIRPKLILMFDANLAWAKRKNVADYEWIEKLCNVYNCESDIEDLDQWPLWSSIAVPPLTRITFGDEELETEQQLAKLLEPEEDDEDFR